MGRSSARLLFVIRFSPIKKIGFGYCGDLVSQSQQFKDTLFVTRKPHEVYFASNGLEVHLAAFKSSELYIQVIHDRRIRC